VFYLEIHQNSIFYILKFVFNINILKRSKNTKNKFNLKQKIFNFFKKIFNFFQKYFCKTNGYLMQRLLLPLLLDTICNSTKTLIIKAYFSFYWTHKNATPYTFIWDISKTNWSADQVQLECFCFWRLDKQQMNMAQTKLEFGLGNDTFWSIQVFKSFLIYTIKKLWIMVILRLTFQYFSKRNGSTILFLLVIVLLISSFVKQQSLEE
jgi:hypothetical protein